MPIYEYECQNCNTRFDKLQSITSEPLTVCDNCGSGPIRRVFQPVGIIFKGSGWYITDNRKSNSAGAGSTSSSTDGKDSSAPVAKSEDSSTKSDTATSGSGSSES